MSRHTKLIAAVLSVLMLFTACASLTVFASNEEGAAPQESAADQQNENSASGNDNGGEAHESGGNDEPQQDDDGHNRDDYEDGRYEDDYDDSYQDDHQNNRNYQDNQDNQDNQSNNRDRDTENESVMYVYYDSDGNEYTNPGDMYVGGDQTYTPPVSTPSTTAALYDTANIKVDEKTLSNGDWADISRKLRTANAAPSNDTGDFTFIQKNTDTGDNGHWMLILGFSLIALGIIGFIYLISRASARKKALAADPAQNTQPQRKPRYSTDDSYGDDFGDH